jgi:WD40 repeat protein/serine/threonine protein kinase
MHQAAPNIEEIFFAALEIEGRDSRSAFLDQACGDPELRRRVVRLLARDAQASGFLESPAAAPPITVESPSVSEGPGTVIGPYRLREQIGEGGMGAVWMAEQTVPVKRVVALKVIKAGMDSRQVLARFEAERQALALMDHPNIAKVLDAGATEHGRPYFVMDLVKGVPITRFCDERRLTPKERLELFIPVCQAIQHAHQKGIIHRDLKPTNVLVGLYDGQPISKIIDFGVAKATGQRLTDATLVTGFGNIVGTLEYMSPEQAEINQLDIDTRSDIHSLGVLLYELLTGTTPFTKKDLEKAGMLEMLRVIREEEPTKPSTKLSTAEGLPTLAANRGTEPVRLIKLVRGELDWIIMKCLEKDRIRRYETANGLAADLRRYLDDEPVQACPPSARYRFGKFARRNKAALMAAVLIAVVMLAAVAMLVVSNLLITREKVEKEAALRRARDSAKAANDQRSLADRNAGLANEQRGIAVANEKAAREQELLARRRFYAAQTNLAQQASEAGQPSRVLELLESLRPKFDQEDLRGFEWYYLWRLCHAGFRSTLRGHIGPVYGLAFSADGRTLASNSIGLESSAGLHSDVKFWDFANGQERITLKKRELESFWRLAFSPDGKTLATCDGTQPTRFWDTASGREIGSFNRRSNLVAFFSDGKTLVTQKPRPDSQGGDLELWDLETGEERATLRGGPNEDFNTVAIAPDGKAVAAGSTAQTVRLWTWDGTQWQEKAPILGHGSSPSVAFSLDSKTLVVGQGLLKSYEVDSGRERVSFQGHVSWIKGLALSPDGKILASGGYDRTVRTWDAATGKELTCRPHASHVVSVAFSPDGKTLAAGCGDGTITLWETDPPPSDVVLSHGGSVFSLAFTPDGRTLVSSGAAPTKLWDVAMRQLRDVAPMEWTQGMSGEDISPDAMTHFIQSVGQKGCTLTLYDLTTWRPGPVLRGHPAGVVAVAYAPDGKTIATASHDGTAIIWDLATGQSRVIIRPKVAGTSAVPDVWAVSFSPDGSLLATGTYFQVVTLWDAATGRERLALEAGDRMGTRSLAVAFSPDGKILAVSGAQGVKLWDVTTGASRGSFNGHAVPIVVLTFSPDGKTLVTGSQDKTVKLWDVATHQERLTLKGHTGTIMSLAFAPDGNTLATGSADGTVRLWHTSRHPEATARNNEVDPDDPETAQGLNTAAERLWSIGRPEESEQAYRKALARASKLTTAFPDHSGYRLEVARSWLGLGLLLKASGRPREAEEARREAMASLQKLPSKAQLTLAFHFSVLADVFRASGHAGEADAASRQSVELGREEAMIWFKRARFDVELGRTEEALTDISKLIALSPTDATIHNDLAWLLATCPDAKRYDPSRAVGLAKRAVELAPAMQIHWNTLGVAHYRAGDWKAAIEALTKSEELAPRKNRGFNAFFLAMAHWQLGDKPQARSWFDKAVQLMEPDPNDEELIRFRAEVAALLEVNEQKD